MRDGDFKSVHAVDLLAWSMRPERARIRGAIEVAERAAGDPSRAWSEAGARGMVPPLVDIVPVRWEGCQTTVTRSFSSVSRVLRQDPPVPPGPLLDAPPDVGACVAFLSDPDGIRRAEWTVMRLGAMIHDHDATHPRIERVVWRFVLPLEWDEIRKSAHPLYDRREGARWECIIPAYDEENHLAYAALSKEERSAIHASIESASYWPWPDPHNTGRGWCIADLYAARQWDAAARRGAVVVQNPYAWLVRLWLTGYCLDGIEGDVATLVCPRVTEAEAC